MAPEIPLDQQRPAEFVFEGLVETMSQKLDREKAEAGAKGAGRAA